MLLSVPERFSKCSFNRPAKPKAHFYGACPEAKASLPFGNAGRFAIPHKYSVVAPIAVLLSMCSPSTVTRRIRAVVVDTVESHSKRPLAHVRQKVSKVSPRIAHEDAATAVPSVGSILRIVTAVSCVSPRAICGCRFLAYVASVLAIAH
jgi:hypothetical protein